MNYVKLFTVSAMLCMTSIGHADTYPTRPVTIVVGYAAGGPLDIFSRALANHMSGTLKQTFIIENRPGANEMIATQQVARAKPDGYTLLASTEAPLTQNQFLYKELSYKPETLTPITQAVHVPMIFAVPPDAPENTLLEFIAKAKARADNPMNIASVGVGGVTHLPMAMLAKNENLPWTHVPYKGAAPLVPDLLNGRVDGTFLAVSILGPFVQDKKLKALVISAPERAATLPDVPTFKELGIKDVAASFIMGLTAPEGTPEAVRETISAAAQKALQDLTFVERNLAPYSFVAIGSTPKDFAAYLEKDRLYQKERVAISGASLN